MYSLQIANHNSKWIHIKGSALKSKKLLRDNQMINEIWSTFIILTPNFRYFPIDLISTSNTSQMDPLTIVKAWPLNTIIDSPVSFLWHFNFHTCFQYTMFFLFFFITIGTITKRSTYVLQLTDIKNTWATDVDSILDSNESTVCLHCVRIEGLQGIKFVYRC